VPDITGLLRDDAVDALNAAQLQLGTVTSLPNPTKPPVVVDNGDPRVLRGPFVFSQSPAAGSAVPVNSSVNVKMRREWEGL
jgi:beta-lactam-binding protein with PASTA domain